MGAQAGHGSRPAVRGCDLTLAKARLVIQGFGAVGKHAARFLAEQHAVLVGVSDSGGAVFNPDGLEVDALIKLKEAGQSVTAYPKGQKFGRDEVIDFEGDIFIPAARPDVVNEANVHRLKAKLVVQGANIPVTPGAEKYLHDKGVLCVPDFIANAGGVICAAMEYAGASPAAVIDQNLSMGKGGVLFAELASVLYGLPKPPVLVSFVGGLGGRDISPEEFYEMAAVTRQASETGQAPPPRLLYTAEELREVRKLQAIAHVERERLGNSK